MSVLLVSSARLRRWPHCAGRVAVQAHPFEAEGLDAVPADDKHVVTALRPACATGAVHRRPLILVCSDDSAAAECRCLPSARRRAPCVFYIAEALAVVPHLPPVRDIALVDRKD